MNEDPQLEQLQGVNVTLGLIHDALVHLGNMTRLPLLYTQDEIRQRVQQYSQVCAANEEASQAIQDALAALPEAAKSRNDFAKEFGEEEASRVFEPLDAAIRMSETASKAMEDFHDEHPLITGLVYGYR